MVRRRSPFHVLCLGLPNSVGILPSSMRSFPLLASHTIVSGNGEKNLYASGGEPFGGSEALFFPGLCVSPQSGGLPRLEAPLMRDVIAPVFFRDTHHACRLVSEPLLVLPFSHAHAQALSFMLSFVRGSLREGERRARSREVSVPGSESNSTHGDTAHFSPV